MVKKQLAELFKTLAIIFLTASALYLTYLSNVGAEIFAPISEFIDSLSGNGGDSTDAPSLTFTEASRPTAIAVRSELGLCGIMYSDEDIDSGYGTLGLHLGEALETAEAPERVDEARWREALLSPGVYFEFPAEAPLSALAKWLGASYGGDDFSRRFDICIEGGEAALFFQSGDDFFRCAAGVRVSVLAELLSLYVPNAAGFAFELAQSSPAYAACDPYSLLPAAASINLDAVTAVNPLNDKEKKNGVITSLGFNPYTSSGYTEPDTGALIFVENNATITIGTNGLVTYLNTAASIEESRFQVAREGETATDAELIETARAAAAEVSTGGGAASLRLSGYSRNDDLCVITFNYYIDGLKITNTTGYAARIIIRNGVISELSLMEREYQTSESGSIGLLPPLYAAAAIVSGEKPLLVPEYADDGGEALSAGWASNS